MSTGEMQQLPHAGIRGRPPGGASRGLTLGASTRLPEAVVLAIREESHRSGRTASLIVADAIQKARPDLPWPEGWAGPAAAPDGENRGG